MNFENYENNLEYPKTPVKPIYNSKFTSTEAKKHAEEFGFTLIETAGHWNELYTGDSRVAVLLSTREDVEIMEIAQRILNINGDYGEACNRAGEHHHTFRQFSSLDDYQECIRKWFDEKYFYRDADTEIESVCELVKEAAEDKNIKLIQKIMNEYNELIPGYYSCGETLVCEAGDINSKEFTGYDYDVFTYRFGFKFENNNNFN
jgi:hypothetical protein